LRRSRLEVFQFGRGEATVMQVESRRCHGKLMPSQGTTRHVSSCSGK